MAVACPHGRRGARCRNAGSSLLVDLISIRTASYRMISDHDDRFSLPSKVELGGADFTGSLLISANLTATRTRTSLPNRPVRFDDANLSDARMRAPHRTLFVPYRNAASLSL